MQFGEEAATHASTTISPDDHPWGNLPALFSRLGNGVLRIMWNLSVGLTSNRMDRFIFGLLFTCNIDMGVFLFLRIWCFVNIINSLCNDTKKTLFIILNTSSQVGSPCLPTAQSKQSNFWCAKLSPNNYSAPTLFLEPWGRSQLGEGKIHTGIVTLCQPDPDDDRVKYLPLDLFQESLSVGS